MALSLRAGENWTAQKYGEATARGRRQVRLKSALNNGTGQQERPDDERPRLMLHRSTARLAELASRVEANNASRNHKASPRATPRNTLCLSRHSIVAVRYWGGSPRPCPRKDSGWLSPEDHDDPATVRARRLEVPLPCFTQGKGRSPDLSLGQAHAIWRANACRTYHKNGA
jgi:hypothetical protein